MIRLLIAAVLLAALGFAQATSYARTPTPPQPTELGWVATATSCTELRATYNQHHNVWRAGVKVGNEPADNLAVMRATLRRIGVLERAGRCGG